MTIYARLMATNSSAERARPWAVGPDEHLREFVERWRDQPAEALACASTSGITAERARELISGEGEPWSLVEASDIGMIMGPSPEFWQRLLLSHRRAPIDAENGERG